MERKKLIKAELREIALESIRENEEYFRERFNDVLSQWSSISNSHRESIVNSLLKCFYTEK